MKTGAVLHKQGHASPQAQSNCHAQRTATRATLVTEVVMGEDQRQVLWMFGQVIRWKQRCSDTWQGFMHWISN